MKFTNTLINTVCHIIIDGQAQEKFYLITHLIMLLQTIACIADPQSLLFLLVRWADPSTYLDPAFSIVLCLLIVATFALLLVAKLLITEPDEMLVKPNTLKIYMGNILLHLQMLSKTSVLAPLIRATILEIQTPDNPGVMVAGVVGLVVYLAFLLPLSLYNTSNTFVLTPQLNKKLTYINIYLLLNLFRVPFAILAPSSQPLLIAAATLFLVVFLALSVKQPIFAYSHERALKGMISAVAFACLIRLCQVIQGGDQQSLILQLVGMASFIGLVDWVAQFRIRKILQLPRPTVHQLKILMFLVYNIKEYFDKLEYFVVRHHRRCLNPECACSAVIAHISSKDGSEEEYGDVIWYKFLIDYIEQFYDLREMQALGESEMRARIEKYQYVVIDLAEMYLFKLGHVNQAYYIVNNYRHLLETRGISFLSFRQKRKIINYYLQENIAIKYHTEGVINLNADTFMNFQLAFEKYRRILLRSARSTAALWEEMAKRDPDGQKLKKLVHVLERWHSRIRKMYVDIVKGFQKSGEILEGLTNDYFEGVLNISAKSPFHVIEKPKFERLVGRGEEKVEKISENMQAFSFNSETPMCFVAVDEQNFGQIVGSNSHFNRTMSLEFGRLARIDEFMVPEMRHSHEIRMKEFIRGDVFSLEHRNGFTLNLRGKIVYTKILVQIMPSIEEGLRYVFFLKKLMPRKKILGLRNGQVIGYTSQSFDESFEGRGRREMMLRILQEQRLASLRESHEIKIEFQDREIFLRFMHEFGDGEANWMFIEFYEQEDVLLETKYNLLGERTSALKKTSHDSRIRKDSVISRDSVNSLERSNLEKSDLQEKLAAQRAKKAEEAIRNTYEIIVDDTKKNISFRIVAFTVAMVLLLLGALLAAGLVKLNNQSLSLATININTAFNQFLMLLTGQVSAMKKLNYNAYTNNSNMATIYFGVAGRQVNITKAMDALVVNFDIGAITQTWNTLTCNATSGTFILGTENSFLTVSDFIQNPVTNLMATSVSAFNFPPFLSGQKRPLTSNPCLYFSLVLNSLYISIPRFLSLKSSIMDGILVDNVGVSLAMILIFVAVFLISGLYVFGKVVLNIRVTRLKNATYGLFQSLSSQLIEQKEKNCKEFIAKYTILNSPDATDDHLLSDHSGSFRTENELNFSALSRNLEKTVIEEETQRDLEVNSGQPQTKTSNFIQSKENLRKRSKTTAIFKKSSMFWIAFKYSLLALPFLLFSFVFGGMEVAQAKQVSNAVKLQSQLQVLQQNVNLVSLYAMQHGTEDNMYPQLLNLPAFLNGLMGQIYDIQRNFVNSATFDISTLPNLNRFLQNVAYGNLCTLPDFNFASYLTANCSTTNSKILTKGLYSSLISYLEEASTLLLAFPYTANFTTAQRMAYLGSPFFTTHAKIVEYLNDIFKQFLALYSSDFTAMIKNSTSVLLFANIGIVVGIGLVGVLLERHYIGVVKKEILEIKSLFLLISYETITKDEALRNSFFEKIEQFKMLK